MKKLSMDLGSPRKLRLDIEELAVESFETEPLKGSGTVYGAETNGYALDVTCAPDTCGGGGYEPTIVTCGGDSCPKSACAGMPTCGPTLNQTCLSCVASQCGGVTPCQPCTG